MKRNSYIVCLVALFTLQSLAVNQPYVHTFSKTIFAENVGNFSIIGPKQYDDIGKDISVGYRTISMIELTQYIYPSNGQELNEHFDNYKKSLLSNKSKAKLLSTENVTTKNIPGKFSKFELNDDFHGMNQKVYSYLYMYKLKGWFIMLRVTCTTVNNSSIEKEINEYVANMPFPSLEYK